MLSSRPIPLPADGTYFPTKTPSRGLKSRAENAHAGGVATTLNAKGKNTPFAPKTPFQPASTQPHKLLKDQKIILGMNRPLGDKTPLPNRFGHALFQTPLPGMSKLSRLSNEAERGDGEGSPDSAQRPSSTRKHIKHPRNSLKAFETPANSGKHWDISDGDIIVAPETLPIVQDAIIEDDMDEVEYGPPNTLDLPYKPPFDFELPDYKEVGKTLFRLAHSYHYDEILVPPEPEFPVSELEPMSWDFMTLPELESDDPFHIARVEAAQDSQKFPAPTSRAAAPNKGGARAIARPLIKSTVSTSSVPASRTSSRPTSRAAPSAAASTTSRIYRATSTASVRPPSSSSLDNRKTADPTRKLVTRPRAGTTTQSAKAPPNLVHGVGKSKLPLTAASGAASRGLNATASNSTSVAGARPATLSRAGTSQRPHTAMSLTSNTKFKSTGVLSQQSKGAVAQSLDDDLIIAMDLDMLEESDFKFDV